MSSRGKGSRRKRTGTKQNANAFVENNQLDNQASTESVNTDSVPAIFPNTTALHALR